MVLNSGGKKKNNVPKIVATFVCASSQGQRTHSARTKIKKMTCIGRFVDRLRLNEIVVTACEVEAVLVLLFVLLDVSIVAPKVDCELVLVSLILFSVFIMFTVDAVIFILPVVSAVGLLV